MANFGRLTALAEKIAARLGYDSAEHAEAQMGSRFINKVEQESFLGRGGAEAQASAGSRMPDIGAEPRIERNVTPPNAAGTREYTGSTDFSMRDTVNPSNLPALRAPSNNITREMTYTPADRELSRQLLLGGGAAALGGATLAGDREREATATPAVSGAPAPGPPRNEPTDQQADAAGSPPSDVTPVGGVPQTVTQTEAEVNRILGRGKPNAGKLRDAVSAYESAAQNLREQSVDTTALDQSLADVRSAYKERADRNELLSLMQMVAQSFGKLAAYNYGSKSGRYIGDQVNAPGVDYEARTNRALEERKLDEGDIRDRRRVELDRADKRYQIEKDRAGSLKERIGAEENALSRDTAMYTSELTAARAADAQARAEGRAARNQQSLEDRLNRQFGAKEYDNVQQEEAVLRQKEQAVTELAGALSADSKDARKRIPALAAKAGVTPEEVEQFRTDTAEKGIIWDSANPQAAANALSSALLPGVREKLDALRERKRVANTMMSTGVSLDTARGQRPSEASGDESTAPAAPQGKLIRSKSTGETRPYDAEMWKKIQASPRAADFEITGK